MQDESVKEPHQGRADRGGLLGIGDFLCDLSADFREQALVLERRKILDSCDSTRQPANRQKSRSQTRKWLAMSRPLHGLEEERDDLPVDLYLAESGHDSEVKDIDSEIDGALWFTALLTRVDGLVLMTPRLEVNGFGVESTTGSQPGTISRALDPAGEERETIDYTHYGTRHRSMMRYCYAIPGSVGFVISQDGDVRAMLRQGDDTLIWENLKLQLHNFGEERPDE